MSATTTAAAAASTSAALPNRTHRALAVAGGVALIAGPTLFFAGLATSPVQDGVDKASYIESLTRDPLLTQVSAFLLHYGNVLMGLGVLALAWLVRGRRGSFPALIGALLASVALLDNSGSLFADWMHLELGRGLDLVDAAAISDAVYGHLLFQLSFGVAPLISVGLLALAVGLVRAGVLGWWTIPAIVVGYAGMLFLPYSIPLLPALGPCRCSPSS